MNNLSKHGEYAGNIAYRCDRLWQLFKSAPEGCALAVVQEFFDRSVGEVDKSLCADMATLQQGMEFIAREIGFEIAFVQRQPEP